MEFPNLGQHCQDSMCKQTDYLPLKCECGGVYCREHFTSHCISTGCGLPSAPTVQPSRGSDQVFRCSSSGCKHGSLNLMPCPKCGKHFCIEHRFHPECPEVDERTLAKKREAMEATRRQFDESNILLQEQITKRIRTALNSSQNARTASKIQLMRLKQKAIGPKTIHAFDRAFFSIIKPKDSTAKRVTLADTAELVPDKIFTDSESSEATPVYVSKKWSLGRAIDTVCDVCRIVNTNATGGNKTRLFRASDGYCVGDACDVDIARLLADQVLLDGDSLIVEYVASRPYASTHLFLNLPVETET